MKHNYPNLLRCLSNIIKVRWLSNFCLRQMWLYQTSALTAILHYEHLVKYKLRPRASGLHYVCFNKVLLCSHKIPVTHPLCMLLLVFIWITFLLELVVRLGGLPSVRNVLHPIFGNGLWRNGHREKEKLKIRSNWKKV